MSRAFFSRRSFLYASSAAITAMLTSTSCRNHATAGQDSNSQGQPLRLGFNLWAGYLPFQLAQDKDLFKSNNLNAEITWFPVLSDQITAFNAGKIDVAGLTIGDFLTGASNGVKGKAVLQMDTSLGDDAVLTDLSVNSLKDLSGKNISVEVGTAEHLLLLQALKKAEIPQNAVQIVNQASDAAITALIAGKTQVAVSYAPFIGQAVRRGKGRIVFSSKDVPGLIADLLVVRQEAIDQRPDAIQKLVNVWYQSLDYQRKNPQEALASEAKRAGVSVEEHREILKGFTWQTSQQSLTNFQSGQTTQSVIYSSELIADFMMSQKLASHKPPSMSELIDDRFLKKYLQTKFS